MDKMLVAVFDSEPDAYKGLDTLRDLHKSGDITLYASTVVTKDTDGTVHVKQAADVGPVGTLAGVLAGGAVGALLGPAGAAAGAATSAAATGAAIGGTAGGMSGMVYDLFNEGVNADFLDDVSEILIPGKSAILAEVDEYSITPVNTKLEQLDGIVFRRPRYEVVDDQLVGESAAFNEEVKELQEEAKASDEEDKAAVQQTLNTVKKRLETIADKAEAKLEQDDKEAKDKINTLESQLNNANDQQREKIQKRINEVKTDQKMRSEKLNHARELARQALTA